MSWRILPSFCRKSMVLADIDVLRGCPFIVLTPHPLIILSWEMSVAHRFSFTQYRWQRSSLIGSNFGSRWSINWSTCTLCGAVDLGVLRWTWVFLSGDLPLAIPSKIHGKSKCFYSPAPIFRSRSNWRIPTAFQVPNGNKWLAPRLIDKLLNAPRIIHQWA